MILFGKIRCYSCGSPYLGILVLFLAHSENKYTTVISVSFSQLIINYYCKDFRVHSIDLV